MIFVVILVCFLFVGFFVVDDDAVVVSAVVSFLLEFSFEIHDFAVSPFIQLIYISPISPALQSLANLIMSGNLQSSLYPIMQSLRKKQTSVKEIWLQYLLEGALLNNKLPVKFPIADHNLIPLKQSIFSPSHIS